MFMSEKISCSLSHIKTEISSDLSSYGFRKNLKNKNKCSDINTCLTDSHLGLNMCWEDTVELQGTKKERKENTMETKWSKSPEDFRPNVSLWPRLKRGARERT